jgi:hypothetical protein
LASLIGTPLPDARNFTVLNQSGVKRSSVERNLISLQARMVRIFLLFLFIGTATSGCADRYQSELQSKTLEAQNIQPVNYRPDVVAFMQTYLNTPENVRDATMSEPQKILVFDTERYAACLRYNAKDGAGRYTGLRDHLAVFVSGKFDRLIELGRVDSEGGSERLKPLRSYCASVAYQPFPELEKLRR